MKKYLNSIRYSRRLYVAAFVTFLAIFALSCSKDDNPVVVPPDNTEVGTPGNDHFLFYADKENPSVFRTRQLDSTLGSADISSGSYLSAWDRMAGVRVGTCQFIVGHNGLNAFFIRSVLGDGVLGKETEHGQWNNYYMTFFGFHAGDRGFIFGQNSYTNYWFVQEVTSGGKLAAETDNGTWHNYYGFATPIYINGKTYIFFQTEESDRYWFISYVSPDGRLSDVCDGYWGDLYHPAMTSVEINGNAYLVYHGINPSGVGEWFIRRINSDGTMGEETDRGKWNHRYTDLMGYTNNNHAYILGHNPDCFIREITEKGKMGGETYHAAMSGSYDFFFPFTFHDPGNFRYTIGWDLSKTTGSPTRSWSGQFWGGVSEEAKFGGGAVLANLDGDSGQRLDAVLTGIEDREGSDRFYYQVAWNLDATGKAAGWSQALYGPECGASQSGGGADIADIDRNGVPDLVLMTVDNPEGANSFWYYIGWNLSTSGQPASWSGKFRQDGLGFDNAGGGLALGDLDGNEQPEMVLVAIDDPAGANQFWYRIGRNLDQSGNAASWTGNIAAPFYVGFQSAGGGAALVDLNGNGKPDLVLMNIDNPKGANPFWCYVGWDIDINGNAVSWSNFVGPSLGNITSGGGTAIGDIDKNGIMDLLLMAIDNPYGKD